jgi:hypothetical protein
MALDFPSTPTVGQIFPTPPIAGVAQYRWDGTAWVTAGTSVPNFIQDNPPSNPLPGQLWWNSTNGMLYIYYYDGDSYQWVNVNPGPMNAVRYDIAQGLTAPQRQQARANIDALKKNYIINGGMQVSQENGTTAGTVNNYYPVDQFFQNYSLSAGTISIAQLAAATTSGSPYRVRATVTAALASPASGDGYLICQRVEGTRFADLLWGGAFAKTITVQFGCRSNVPGTYCVAVQNNAANRSYVGMFSIAAGEVNTDVVKSVVIPGDTTGTWTTDSSIGISVYWCLVSGSGHQTPAGIWTAGNFYGTAGQSNLFATNGNTFDLFDVGVYEGSVAPLFMLPDYGHELLLCQRYWESTFPLGTVPGSGLSVGGYLAGCTSGAASNAVSWDFKVEKRPGMTITTYNPYSAGNSGFSLSGSSNAGATQYATGPKSVTLTNSGTLAAGSLLSIHAKSDSRM